MTLRAILIRCGLVAVVLTVLATRVRAEDPPTAKPAEPAPTEPAPTENKTLAPSEDAEPAAEAAPAPPPAPKPLFVSTPAPRLNAPTTCVSDTECKKNESCEEGRCVVTAGGSNAWPIYGSRPGPNGYRYVPPFLYFEKRFDGGATRVQFPLFVSRTTAAGDRTTVVPPLLFARWKSHDDKTSGIVVGPFIHARNPERTVTTLFPLFWRVKDNQTGAQTNVLFPLAAFRTEKDRTFGFVGPFYGWSGARGRGGEAQWGGGVAPLLFFGHSGTKRHAIVVPIFARWSDSSDGSATTAIGPFYVAQRDHGVDFGAIPVLFVGAHPGRNYVYLPPLFWHRHAPEGNYDIVGPAYGYSSPRGWAGGLAPLLFFGNVDGKEHHIVFPLIWHFRNQAQQQEELVVGPFYHGRDHDTTKDALFPLFYLKQTPTTKLLVSPVAFWKKDLHKELLIVGPYAQAHNDATNSSTHVFFPLFWKHDAPDYHFTILFPLVWKIQDGTSKSTAVVPFYYGSRTPSMAFDYVFPLIASIRTKARNLTIAGPAFYEKQPEGRTVGVLPIFGYASRWSGGHLRRWFASPLAYYDEDREKGTKHFWMGPFGYSQQPDGFTAALAPLFAAWRRGTVSHFISPIFYRQSDSAAQSETNVLGPLYWGKSAETKRFGLAPIIFTKWSTDGTAAATVFPLLHFAKKKDGALLVTPLGGYKTYPGGYKAEVGPFYWRRDKDYSSTAFWPLIYHGKNLHTGEKTTVAIPLYFNHWQPNGTSISAYTPLIWHYKDVEQSVTVAFPLFFDHHAYGESRTTGVFPFAIVHKNYVDKSSSIVIPPLLTYVRKRGVDDPGYDAVFFPLIWRFGGRNPTTIGFPLFWDFKRGTDRTTVFLPVAAHWKRDENDHTLVLNTYVRKGKGPRAGQWWVDFFPLVSFGHPRKGDVEWNILEGLIGYNRQARERTLRLFWFIEVKLDPSKQQGMTFFDQATPADRTKF